MLPVSDKDADKGKEVKDDGRRSVSDDKQTGKDPRDIDVKKYGKR